MFCKNIRYRALTLGFMALHFFWCSLYIELLHIHKYWGLGYIMIMHMYDLLGTLSRLLFAFISTITVLFMHISLYQGGIQKPVANKQMLSYRRVHSRNQFATNCFAAIYFLKYLFVTCIIGCGRSFMQTTIETGGFSTGTPWS